MLLLTDDVDDPIDRHTDLGDVCRHDALTGARLGPRNSTRLSLWRHTRVEGKRLQVIGRGSHLRTKILNLVDGGEENENVTGTHVLMDVLHCSQSSHTVVWSGLREVADVDGKVAAGDLEQLGTTEVGLELGGIEGRRHDDDLEVIPNLQGLLEEGHEQVCGNGSLVGLVDDDSALFPASEVC